MNQAFLALPFLLAIGTILHILFRKEDPATKHPKTPPPVIRRKNSTDDFIEALVKADKLERARGIDRKKRRSIPVRLGRLDRWRK